MKTIEKKDIKIIGASWILESGYGQLADKCLNLPSTANPQIPRAKEIFHKSPGRFGRFDGFTKLGLAGAAMALRDAGLENLQEKTPIGQIISSYYGCLETDLEYYETSLEEEGLYTSPNLFSYTLPGIVLGETALHFKLSGPSLYHGETGTFGSQALKSALLLLQVGQIDTLLCGWLDFPPEIMKSRENYSKGACFLVLSVNHQYIKQNAVDFPSSFTFKQNIFDLLRQVQNHE